MDNDTEKGVGTYRAFRISAELDRALHELVERMSSPYHRVNLSTAIRAALIEGIAVLDKKLPPLPAKPGSSPAQKKRGRPKTSIDSG